MARKKDNPYKTRGGFDALLEEQLQDPEIRVVYERERALTVIAMAVRQLRRREGMTQAELARRIETSQPAIARLESGRGQRFPTLPLEPRCQAPRFRHLGFLGLTDKTPGQGDESAGRALAPSVLRTILNPGPHAGGNGGGGGGGGVQANGPAMPPEASATGQTFRTQVADPGPMF